MKVVKIALLGLCAFFRRDCSPKIVFYHDVGKKYTPMGTHEEVFLSHMNYLRQENRCPEKDIHMVAFDDGFRGVWDNRELLRQMEIRPTVFLAVALVGMPGYLTWDEVRVLQNDYGFSFQCHTWSHQTLTGPVNVDLPKPDSPNFRSEDWYRRELIDSKKELERQLNCGVNSLCFPVGYYSDDVIRRCKSAGYAKVFASYPGNITDDYVQPRCLCQDADLFTFKNILRGGMNSLANHYKAMHYCKDA